MRLRVQWQVFLITRFNRKTVSSNPLFLFFSLFLFFLGDNTTLYRREMTEMVAASRKTRLRAREEEGEKGGMAGTSAWRGAFLGAW